MSAASDRVYFHVFCSFCPGVLDWRPTATGINVSSQEAPGCCQGNESHGSTKRIITHGWCFWGAGRTRTRCTIKLAFCFRSVSLASGGSISHSLKKRHITRTEYSFQCTCSRVPPFCTLGAGESVYQQAERLEKPTPSTCLNASVTVKVVLAIPRSSCANVECHRIELGLQVSQHGNPRIHVGAFGCLD